MTTVPLRSSGTARDIWEGVLPPAWSVAPLKHVTVQVSRGNTPDYVDEGPVRVLNQACVQWSGLRPDACKYHGQPDVGGTKGELRPFDVVMNSTGTGTLGRVQLFTLSETWMADGHVTVIRCAPDRLDPRFLTYVLTSRSVQNFIYAALVVGATNQIELNVARLRSTTIPTPSLLAQRAIADYLDHETARIDALVAKKRRLMDLLEERKRGLLDRVLQGGIAGGERARESGVHGLGRIPDHWLLIRLKFLASVHGGVTKGRDLRRYDTIELPYLRVANVQDGYINLDDIAMIEVLPEEVGRYSLKPGDVLMNEGGDLDKLGRGAVWDGSISPCLHQNHVFAIRPRAGINPHWLTTVTRSRYAKQYFETRGKQTTNLASISATNLAELPVVLPPIQEQFAILRMLGDKEGEIDTLIDRLARDIDLLIERRQALITAAVTGQIDVSRGAA